MRYDDLVVEDYHLNLDCYYHAFHIRNMNSILTEGIKSQLLLHHSFQGNNGPFYVSVSKKDNFDSFGTIYNTFNVYGWPMLILDDEIKAYKTSKSDIAGLFINTPIPIRFSPYPDEYQVFMNIKPEHIIGVRAINHHCEKNMENLRRMALVLKGLSLDIPIFDYTYEKKGVIRELDIDKCIKL